MYAPHTERDVAEMLKTIGAESLDDLLRVPEPIALKEKLDIVPALPEYLIQRRFDIFAQKNPGVGYRSFLGAGAYRHYVPPAIAALAMRGEFLTAYTPYQAEVSQGYLQAIYEWQSYICLLTGMDIANASVYDGATALAEAAIMALGATGRQRMLVSRAIHPNYRAVLRTYCDGLDVEVDEIPLTSRGTTDLAALEPKRSQVKSTPRSRSNRRTSSATSIRLRPKRSPPWRRAGRCRLRLSPKRSRSPHSPPPASWGAQIVAGEAQSFGIAQAYGGPYAGFIAATQEHVRRIPGRLAGKTVDNAGRTAYVLTLQAREQHIRRERATSNICTNQAHCALIATIYLALDGQDRTAHRCRT